MLITQFYQRQGSASPIKVMLSEQNLRQPGYRTFPVQRHAPAAPAARRQRAGLQQSRGGGRVGDAHDQRTAPVAGEQRSHHYREGAHRLRDDPGPGGAGAWGGEPAGLGSASRGLLAACPADLALVALFSAGLGVALGALLQRIQPVGSVAIVIALYLFFLTGGTAVLAFDPAWLQTIATFVPLYYGRHALEMAIFYQSSDQLGRDVAVLAGSALLAI